MAPPSATRPHQQREAAGHRHHLQQQQQPGPQATAGQGSPAVVSLQREITVALDASQPLAARCTSLGKLHAVMASHQAHRPAVAVAMLPLFLSKWPQLVACLWDTSTPQLAAAAAPLLGIVGALVASSRAAAAAAEAASAAAAAAGAPGQLVAASAAPAASHGPPPPPASLLFDWVLPLLTGAVPLPTGAPAPAQLQVLLCKTLAYALQQLPSCDAPGDASQPGQHTRQAQTIGDATGAGVSPELSGSASAPAVAAVAAGEAGAAAATGATAASAAGAKGKLLTAPVPPVAAEQLQLHAAAVMRAVQQLLEAASTPPELLGPLLQLLLEVIRLTHTVASGSVLQDLVDLLLGWSLEPGLQAKDRQLISRVLVALRPSWLAQPQLATDVAGKLLADLHHLLPPMPAQPAAPQSAAVPASAGAGTASVADAQAAGSPGAVDAAAAAAQPAAGQQHEEQARKLLALLSCLVAILRATCDAPGDKQLVLRALEFHEQAHRRMAALAAAAAAASSGLPDSCWSAAATSLAGSMLALWEAVVSASTSNHGGAAAAEPAETQREAGSAALDVADVSERTWALVLATLQLPLLPAEDAVGLLGSISRALTLVVAGGSSGSSNSTGIGSGSSGSAAAGPGGVTGLGEESSNSTQQGNAGEGLEQAGGQSRVVWAAAVPEELPINLWHATQKYRCSPLADVQAAAAAAYTAAVLVADMLAPPTSPSQAPLQQGSSNPNSARASNAILAAVLSEVSGLCSSMAQPVGDSSVSTSSSADPGLQAAPKEAAAGAGAAGQMQGDAQRVPAGCQQGEKDRLQGAAGGPSRQQQQLSKLLFDLVLLESWLSCAGPSAAQDAAAVDGASAAAAPSAATAAVGSCAAAAAGQLAGVLLTGLQGLLQPPPQPARPHAPQQQQQPSELAPVAAAGMEADADLLDQVLAVLAALLAHAGSSPAAAAAGQAAAVGQTVLSCLELLLSSPAVEVQHQVAAVQLLPHLLQQPLAGQAPAQQQGPGSSQQCPSAAAVQKALSVLQAAAASAAVEVRAAATDVACQAAHAALQAGLQQPGSAAAGELLLLLLQECAQLLASRCQDVDAAVAAAAQAAMGQLALPLYLLSVCEGDSDSSSQSALASSSTHSMDVSSDGAGVGGGWRRLAALQPQQRAFKAAQLAQLFDVSFHASPGMLQRYSLRAPQQQQQLQAQQQQPPQLKLAAHDATLFRLAQSLPLLPAAAGSGSSSRSGSSSSSAGIVLQFEDLSSAAVASWLLTQEAARQCVSARIRTHLGNPTQSFGALERVVQALLQQLQGDESPQAQQQAWQRQLLQQMQAAIPQQQAQTQQAGAGSQAEPQQLLQAPGAAVGAAVAAHAAQRRPSLQQQGSRASTAVAADGGVAAAAAAWESRLESEAAVGSLLDFMHALEVNVQAAIEGSMMRPAVSKSVMAFFAGNKKVCEDWFGRTRESLLWLSAAAGAHQHVLFHGMARLQELQAQLKALTAHSQAQQQLLQQERDRQKAQQQEGSATAAAASAAAAAAITGLGGGQQQERGRDRQPQLHGQPGKAADSGTEQRKLRGRHQATPAQAAGDADQQQPAAGAAPSVSEQLRLLQQQYKAALLQLAAPVLSTLVLLADACVAAREPHVLLGLQQWTHKGFHPVWDAVCQLYALDLLTAADEPSSQVEDLDEYLSVGAGAAAAAGADARSGATGRDPQQQPAAAAAAAPSMLLLSWLPAAAAQAAGRYEQALLHYRGFLASEGSSTGLGAACRAWIQEQMACCYAALAEWEGLAQLCSTQRQQQQQPDAQQQGTSIPWVQHWQFAGATGVKQLQEWSAAASGPEQHQGMGLQTIEQHLGAHARGGRGGSRGRGRGATHHADRGQSQHSSLQQLLRLDLQGRCFAGVAPAALAVLHATAALEVCGGGGLGGGSSSAVDGVLDRVGESLEQLQLSPRGRGGRARAKGRHSAAGHGHSQHHALATALDPEQRQLALEEALREVSEQVETLEQNPYVVCPAFSPAASMTGAGRGCSSSLPLLRLLQGQLAAALQQQPQHCQQHTLQSAGQLAQLLEALSVTSGHHGGSSRAPASAGAVWSGGLRLDGQLAGSLFQDPAKPMLLLQCLASTSNSSSSSSTADRARQLILREALLACHSHGCSNTLQRLLQAAAASSDPADASTKNAASKWLQLLGSKLQQRAAATSAVRAAEAHLQVLQQHMQQLLALEAGSTIGDTSADAGCLSAAYLSLAAVLPQAPSWDHLCASCPALGPVDFSLLHARASQLFAAGLPGCTSAAGAASALAPLQDTQQAVLACAAAAVSLVPQHPAPWKAYGDLLFDLASSAAQDAGDTSLSTATQPQQQAQGEVAAVYAAAAAEAYCQHLATSANSGCLASPQQGLGVLLRLMRIILQHGEQLHEGLSGALAACPAAVWQVLTNQLLAQLQHSSTAVRGLIQQLLQGLAVVVPCAVLYPLVVEVRAAQEAGQEVPPEVSAVVSQLQRVQPRMMADTVAMAEALEGLTVTRWEAWAGLLVELSLETNRKLLSLRADVSRQDRQHLPPERRVEAFLSRCNTVMTPVIASLQQHIAAATSAEPVSPDDASFRQELLPQLTELLEALKQPPEELLKLASGKVQSEGGDSDDASDDPDPATPAAPSGKQRGDSTTKAADAAPQSVDSGGWPLLKQLRQRLQQHLRRQQHLQLAAVAPQLSKLRNTAIPLPADDMTADMLPPLPLKAALERYTASEDCPSSTSSTAAQGPGAAFAACAGASLLLSSTGAAAAAADPASGGGSSSWLCIAAFDKQVAVLPTKTRPKRLLMLASDGSVHAFLLKGRDDLRVDERLMQFMQASNAVLAAQPATQGVAAAALEQPPSSAAAAVVAGWGPGARKAPLRVRPYSITPFGRRAGLVQWVRHTTSLFGLFRNWQQCAAERYQAVAAAKRDAAANAAAAASAAAAAAAGGGQGDRQTPQTGASAASGKTGSTAAAAPAAADAATVPLPLIVAASRPTDAFYARLLPALQAAGLPVGSARSSWPASVLRSTFASLVREAPKALLARQLLSGAAEPGGWWSCQQAFTASAAAGSVVGWLLGLGDRHMDNLLLDRHSCEVVHIDFSVCFDKGASLAVPEVVPFRLTQMMQVALGPGGLQGPFSAACAGVLATLRSSADLLCGLLQLLLSDSAVDWSVDREAHAARKDQDTAVGLRLCASRLEELRQPLLANLAAALPSIGNGLAAIVSYGEAHVFMLQLQSTAAAAHVRAAAASQAISDAAADEVRALTSGATASKDAASLTSDYRRLCGLASGCIQSAGSWLGRHVETLAGFAAAPGHSSGLGLLLASAQRDWDAADADRPLLLLSGNPGAAAAGADTGSAGKPPATGLLVQALGSFLPATGGSPDADAAAAAELQELLPQELVQHCLQLDSQGQQLLLQQQELVVQGRWSLAAYAAVLAQLLSGGDDYIRTSHHWAWSSAFTAAAAGPDIYNISTATATAPQLPTREDVAATWAVHAACWSAACVVQKQHEAAVAAVSSGAGSSQLAGDQQSQEAAEQLLRSALQQLSGTMSSSAAEADAARVQFVASKALLAACNAVSDAAVAAADCGAAASAPSPQQQAGEQGAVAAAALEVDAVLPRELHALQLQLAALHVAMAEYEQAGLAFVLDPSTSHLSEELPEAATSLEDLIDAAGDADQAAAAAAAAAMLKGQQPSSQQHWQQQLLAASAQLQLLPQLLMALQFEALAPIAAWHAHAAQEGQAAADPRTDPGGGTPRAAAGQQQQQSVLLPAGPVSQQQLWAAVAAHVRQHWQQLQALLLQATELEGHMHALAAVAAAGGAAAIWAEDADLMSRAIALQQLLLPQGFDILTTDECVASAQLLQAQWTDVEQRLWVALAEALCPLLGLPAQQQGQGVGPAAGGARSGALQDPGAAVAVLRQLLEAAGASVGSAAIMHGKDVLDALGAVDGSSDGSMWGVPGLPEAWRCLVLLLLQYGCLQQQLLRAAQDHEQAAPGAAAVAGPEATVDVLRGSQALPLEVETQRPLFAAVQAVYELLCCQQPHTAAPASAGDAASGAEVPLLQQQLQGIILPPLLQQLLPRLQQQLRSLQQHLSALASEAGGVLARFHAPQQPHHQLQDGLDIPAAAAAAPGSRSNEGPAGPGSGGEEGAGLVPFDAFDMSLPGADMMLEGGLEEDQDSLRLEAASAGDAGAGGRGPAHGSRAAAAGAAATGPVGAAATAAAAAAAGLPELVPFDAFDEGLEGAGMVLEGGSEGGGLEGGGFFDLGADGADLLGGALEDEPAGLEAADDSNESYREGVAPAAGAAALPGAGEVLAEADALAAQLLSAGQHAAAASLQQQLLAGLQQAQGTCAWQQQVWLRHLAAFEWLWGDMLPQAQLAEQGATAYHQDRQRLQDLLQAAAASLGMPAHAATAAAAPGDAYQQFCAGLLPELPPQPGAEAGQQHRMPTSLELLQSWQVLCEQQAASADALQAWRSACAAAAADVGDVLLGRPDQGLQVTDPTVCRKMLSGAVARAGHWLAGAGRLCSSLGQQAEAALQLEYSRRGRLWAPGMPEGVDAFQGNSALLQQLSAAATALDQAQAQVTAADALLASSQTAAAQAQAAIEEAVAEAAAAEQQLALKTPAALARAQGLVPVLEPMVAAAETALPYVTDGLGATLRALVTLVERNSAARDLAPVVKSVCAQHTRCLRALQRLHDIGAAAVAGLSGVLQGMQLWQQQQGLPAEQQSAEAVLAGGRDPARDAQLLQLLLTGLQPALSGVKDELGELGQAHVLFTHLSEQLDSLAGAAETVAAAISSDHAMQMPAPGQGRLMPAAACTGSSSSSSSGAGSRKQRAEARQRAFAAAALARATARLTGQRPAAVKGPAAGAEASEAVSTAGASVERDSSRSSPAGLPARSVADEVAALVAAATSVDKLSRMYEGWAAWL